MIFEVAFSPCLPESTDRLGIATSMWELHMAREGTRSQLADEDAAGDAGEKKWIMVAFIEKGVEETETPHCLHVCSVAQAPWTSQKT